jgi:Ca2+-binding EF-hand superfamily protein
MESHQISNKISLTTLDRMKSYTKSLLFRQCVQYIIAYRCEINEQEAEKFRKVFFKIDRDNNGFVTFDNVKEFFSSYFEDV